MIAECTRSLAHHSNVNASAASSITTTWANGHWLNIFTGGVIAMLVILSIILTASVMFPNATNETVILVILGGGCLLAVLIALTTLLFKGRSGKTVTPVKKVDPALCNDWRMPPLDELLPARLSLATRSWMFVLRAYLVLAGGLVLV